MKNIKISSILLDLLNDVTHLSLELMSSRGAAYKMFNDEVRPYQVKKSVHYLQSRKYVQSKYVNGEEIMQITPLGRKKVFKYHYDELEIKRPKIWDKKWRMVIFDIPEKRKAVRNSINMKLKELGFLSILKSTYIYPFECESEVEFIKSYFYLNKEISYALVEYIDREQEFKNKFKL